MSKLDDRIVVWRNAIQLFHKYERHKYTGAFRAAGFDKYVVEMPFLTRDGDEVSPDIVASGKNGWMIIELTTSQNSKNHNLNKYLLTDPQYLGQYGLTIHKENPDVIVGRLQSINDGPFCKIILNGTLQVENAHYISNNELRDELILSDGLDLSKLPQIPITLLPEMESKTGEIRRGLVDIVMQIFDPDCSGKDLIQIVDEGLDKLANVVNVKKKKSLIQKVENEMGLLIQKHLKEYLEYKDGKYQATKKFTQHHMTLEAVANALKEWAGSSQVTLYNTFKNDDFDSTKKEE